MQLKATHLPNLLVCVLLLARCADGSNVICSALVTALTRSDSLELYRMLKKCGNGVQDFNDIPILHGLLERKTTKLEKHLKEFRNQGFDINQKNFRGQTAVSFAASIGDLSSVKVLSNAGADLGIRDAAGRTALHHAVEHGPRTGVVAELLRNGADVNAQDKQNRRTPFMYAARLGNVEQIKLMLAHGADPNHGNLDGCPVLHEACLSRNVNVVELLLERGANVLVRTPGEFGGSALDAAVAVPRNHDIVKLLLSKNVDFDARCISRSALDYAVDMNDTSPIALFLGVAGADPDATELKGHLFDNAIARDHYDIAVMLLDSGIDINKIRNCGTTYLTHAARTGNLLVAELLLDRGAKIDLKDFYGKTPLHSASEGSSTDMAALLLDRGAKIELKDFYGQTPLHIASEGSSTDMAALLLRRGADIDARDNYERTPLHAATIYRRLNLMLLLLDENADVNAKNKHGMTPIFTAAITNHTEGVKLLISKGADVNAVDKNRQTPLHLAAQLDSLGVIKLLISKGAIVDVKDKNGQTPYDVAVSKGHFNIARLLERHAHGEDDPDGWVAMP